MSSDRSAFGRHAERLALAIAPWVLNACAAGGPLADCKADFAKGQYPRAKADLQRIDQRARAWTSPERAQYALYRGLTSEALGDRRQAALWLREARAIEDAAPGTLAPLDAKRLSVGLDTVR
ncbi:MAG: hypothetical protein ABTD50_00490 [Polyangiaceae bacterium]|jgi:hypothetical protein